MYSKAELNPNKIEENNKTQANEIGNNTFQPKRIN
jgi:hypothetical protein